MRLKQDLNKKNMFILLTRHYYIEQSVFKKISEQLLSHNNECIILFISGTNHTYFESMNFSKFYDYGYTTFRPNIKTFISELFF